MKEDTREQAFIFFCWSAHFLNQDVDSLHVTLLPCPPVSQCHIREELGGPLEFLCVSPVCLTCVAWGLLHLLLLPECLELSQALCRFHCYIVICGEERMGEGQLCASGGSQRGHPQVFLEDVGLQAAG